MHDLLFVFFLLERHNIMFYFIYRLVVTLKMTKNQMLATLFEFQFEKNKQKKIITKNKLIKKKKIK